MFCRSEGLTLSAKIHTNTPSNEVLNTLNEDQLPYQTATNCMLINKYSALCIYQLLDVVFIFCIQFIPALGGSFHFLYIITCSKQVNCSETKQTKPSHFPWSFGECWNAP
jgi:hypothetical protein